MCKLFLKFPDKLRDSTMPIRKTFKLRANYQRKSQGIMLWKPKPVNRKRSWPPEKSPVKILTAFQND